MVAVLVTSHLAAFLAGAALGTFALAWWFFRLFATREEAATAPRDPYVEGLLPRHIDVLLPGSKTTGLCPPPLRSYPIAR